MKSLDILDSPMTGATRRHTSISVKARLIDYCSRRSPGVLAIALSSHRLRKAVGRNSMSIIRPNDQLFRQSIFTCPSENATGVRPLFRNATPVVEPPSSGVAIAFVELLRPQPRLMYQLSGRGGAVQHRHLVTLLLQMRETRPVEAPRFSTVNDCVTDLAKQHLFHWSANLRTANASGRAGTDLRLRVLLEIAAVESISRMQQSTLSSRAVACPVVLCANKGCSWRYIC